MLSQEDRYITPHIAARILKIAEGTLANWRFYGKGPSYIKLGSAHSARIFYEAEDLHDWMKARKIRPHSNN